MTHRTRWTAEDPPNVLLAIDPGASYPRSKVPYAGVSLFQWGMLAWCGLVKCSTVVPPFGRSNELVRRVCKDVGIARHKNDEGEGLDVLVVENPTLYRQGAARPKDIIALKEIYGAFMGGIDAAFYSGPSPQMWKGSAKDSKDLVNERTLQIANSTERLLLIRAQANGLDGLSDHVLDSMGLGFWTLGRMGTAGVV